MQALRQLGGAVTITNHRVIPEIHIGSSRCIDTTLIDELIQRRRKEWILKIHERHDGDVHVTRRIVGVRQDILCVRRGFEMQCVLVD